MNRKFAIVGIIVLGLLTLAYSSGRYYIAQNIDETLEKIEKRFTGVDLEYKDFSIDPLGMELVLHDVSMNYNKEFIANLLASFDNGKQTIDDETLKLLDSVTFTIDDLAYRKCDFNHAVPRFCEASFNNMMVNVDHPEWDKVKEKISEIVGGPLEVDGEINQIFNEKENILTSNVSYSINKDFSAMEINQKVSMDFDKLDQIVGELQKLDTQSIDQEALTQMFMQNLSVFTEMELGQMGMKITGSKSWNLLLARILEEQENSEAANAMDFDTLRSSKYMDGETRWDFIKDIVTGNPMLQKAEYAGLVPFIKDFIKNPDSLSIEYKSDKMKNLMTLFLENSAIPVTDGLKLKERGISFEINNKAVDL